jgi:hypothetical protein
MMTLNVDQNNYLAHGGDNIDINYSIEVQRFDDGKYKETNRVSRSSIKQSCDEILSAIHEDLYSHPGESEIEGSIRKLIEINIVIDKEELGIRAQDKSYIAISNEMMKRLRYHFEALGFVTCEMMEYMTSYDEVRNEICWRLTDKGRLYIANMYAFKKPTKA